MTELNFLVPYLFVTGAALSFLLRAKGSGRSWMLWVPATAAFGLAIGRDSLVAFLGLFVVPTILIGVGALRSRGGHREFLAFSLSDLALAGALSLRNAETAAWSLPEPGMFGPGAVLVVAAATLRLAGIQNGARSARGGMLDLGWWQGLYLVWLVGRSGGWALAGAGLAVWAWGLWLAARGGESGHAFGVGLAALLGVLGAGGPVLAVAGVAAVAFELGERAASVWTLAILPLSAGLTVVLPAEVPPWVVVSAAAFPFAWAAIAYGLPRGTRAGGSEASGSISWALAALVVAGSMALTLGRPELLAWMAYGLAAAGLAAAGLSAGGGIDLRPLSAAREAPAAVFLGGSGVGLGGGSALPVGSYSREGVLAAWEAWRSGSWEEGPSEGTPREVTLGAVLGGPPVAPPQPESTSSVTSTPPAPTGMGAGRTVAFALPGWGALALALALEARLVMMGLQTGFL